MHNEEIIEPVLLRTGTPFDCLCICLVSIPSNMEMSNVLSMLFFCSHQQDQDSYCLSPHHPTSLSKGKISKILKNFSFENERHQNVNNPFDVST